MPNTDPGSIGNDSFSNEGVDSQLYDSHKYDYLHAEGFNFDYMDWAERFYDPHCTCSVCHRLNSWYEAATNKVMKSSITFITNGSIVRMVIVG